MARFFFLFTIFFSVVSYAQPAQVAIVIDDIGYRVTDRQVLNLPGDITYAILPHTPYGKRIAEIAYKKSHDVILHIPMESALGKKLGPGALTSDMDEIKIRQTLNKSFQEIPFAIGANNHMGSYLTTLSEPMFWTMRFLKEKELLFLDSVTSPKTLARKIATQIGVPAMSRHVFLDNHLDHDYISGQFDQLIAKAQRNQVAIAIAHPHPETLASLAKLIPTLKTKGINLVPLSKLYPALTPESTLTAQASE